MKARVFNDGRVTLYIENAKRSFFGKDRKVRVESDEAFIARTDKKLEAIGWDLKKAELKDHKDVSIVREPKADYKASAIIKLKALGLTDDEIGALRG